MFCVAPYKESDIVELYRAQIMSVQNKQENTAYRTVAEVGLKIGHITVESR